MNKSKLSHDILNILERLRIMHELIKEQNYQHIPKDELMKDLQENLDLLKKHFDLLSTDQ
jgi:CRISPR/Cas system-associated endonuclease Cas3-HD